jgi:hypothetical protein
LFFNEFCEANPLLNRVDWSVRCENPAGLGTAEELSPPTESEHPGEKTALLKKQIDHPSMLPVF